MWQEPVVEELFGGGRPDRTILTLPLISLGTSSITSEGAGEGADILDKVVEFCGVPRTKKEIQDFCKIKSDRYVRQKVIQPLLNQKKIARTIPDKISSPNQKYVKLNVQ